LRHDRADDGRGNRARPVVGRTLAALTRRREESDHDERRNEQ
jgi:hypothetical protein